MEGDGIPSLSKIYYLHDPHQQIRVGVEVTPVDKGVEHY